MKPLDHIKRLLDETHRIQWHGHCTGNAAAWSAVNDIEIAVHELRKAFEQKISDKKKNERSSLWKMLLKLPGRITRRSPSGATGE